MTWRAFHSVGGDCFASRAMTRRRHTQPWKKAMIDLWQPKHGPLPLGPGRWRFQVWAPFVKRVMLHIVHPVERTVALTPTNEGYATTVVDGLLPGARYFFDLGGAEYPDPASRTQPQGVHGPSELIDLAFAWTDTHWRGIPLDDYVIYELDVGTFTQEGTFEAAIRHLGELRSLGITAVELMPIAQFPGRRNLGYDGAYPFAVQNSYGGPRGLQAFVDACHAHGLAVILDVVYNHAGPEGVYLDRFGPYFTPKYPNPGVKPLTLTTKIADRYADSFLKMRFSG